MINFNGESVEIMELSRRYNVPWSTINNRYIRGIRGDKLISKEPLSHILFKGEMVGWTELYKKFGIPVTTLSARYKDGLRDDALVKTSHRGKFSKNAAKKLVKEDVIEIKKLLLIGELNQQQIAAKYNIDPSHVSDIKRGKRWSEIVIDATELLPKN